MNEEQGIARGKSLGCRVKGAALPLDVRKGFAFPANQNLFLRLRLTRPRRSLGLKKGSQRKAIGFPHIRRQSRSILGAAVTS